MPKIVAICRRYGAGIRKAKQVVGETVSHRLRGRKTKNERESYLGRCKEPRNEQSTNQQASSFTRRGLACRAFLVGGGIELPRHRLTPAGFGGFGVHRINATSPHLGQPTSKAACNSIDHRGEKIGGFGRLVTAVSEWLIVTGFGRNGSLYPTTLATREYVVCCWMFDVRWRQINWLLQTAAEC